MGHEESLSLHTLLFNAPIQRSRRSVHRVGFYKGLVYEFSSFNSRWRETYFPNAKPSTLPPVKYQHASIVATKFHLK